MRFRSVRTVICDNPEDISEGASELISSTDLFTLMGIKFVWQVLALGNSHRRYQFQYSRRGLGSDAEDLTAPMFFGIMNATPPSESVEECTPGSVDTEDEAKILTMGYDEGAYDVIGDHELR